MARLAQEEGAEVVLTGAGRGLSLTRRTAAKLPRLPHVLELDVTNDAHFTALASSLGKRWQGVDGVLQRHRLRSARLPGRRHPVGGMGRRGRRLAGIGIFPEGPCAGGAAPHGEGERRLGWSPLDFDARVAWPAYDWMGVAKAALESTARYLARDLGPARVRVNLVAAGPVRTVAARSIPEFARFEDVWAQRAPLGWEIQDSSSVVRACVALLSDWFPMTTGEMLHAVGA